MLNKLISFTAVAIFLGGCTTSPQQAVQSDLDRAVTIASSTIEQEGYAISEYTLTAAARLVHQDQWIWRITYKPNDLLPENPATKPVGLGGELFVNVDLKTDKAVITHGE